MGDVWIGSYKFFVAVARFVDGNVIERSRGDSKGKTKMNNHVNHANTNVGGAKEGSSSKDDRGASSFDVGGGRSFLDSVLNRNKVDVIKVDDNVEGFLQWHGVTLVGKVGDFIILTSLKMKFKSCGWASVSIRYLGGFSVVLVFSSRDDAESFLAEKIMWSTWFEDLYWCDGSTGGVEERLAWIQVHGVPVQLAIDQVFESIGGRYGKVVKPANMSTDDNDFSCGLTKMWGNGYQIAWKTSMKARLIAIRRTLG
ncbi:hypothetical protein HanXRQr2_Chr13g0571781 [Helianthus annuus]|uniref:DUF4283 domain-containing protein n=1 Tax=Helianthus annuus TaxID=4232 RepID=A0A9K3EFL9_HELAN|nr:hypothetical protein HanXRQr2_Chr13g0571781 [Helianthus annuus]KAJ0475710.1 hypothetical protein HanHA300_Chr13g0468691 [Helianthus annuus]KAJ0479670.1 hypothetical protein HanIR_Chr13g0622681 [Helianthus annuus]KAJ0496497.1 hypothetical protein HanHA89_Chr13g0500481 [Helianthus annuus]KAJ0662554.1 hypothetical protein HanLR1_Chr13g0470891 [Helianthus annuus]